MRMVSESEAFGGRWAASPLGWLILLLPSTLLVVVQDSATPFSSPLLLVASAFAQHVIAGGLTVALVAVLHRRTPIIAAPVIFAIWAVAGLIRGLVGGTFASIFAGAPPDYLYRSVFWIVVAVVWLPLFTYLFTQLDSRRVVLIELASVSNRIEQEKRRAHLSTAELRSSLVAAVRDAAGPLIADVRDRLALAAQEDAEIPLGPISTELESIATEANSIIARPVDDLGPIEKPLPPLHWAPTLEAMTFDRSRPVLATLLTMLAVAALLVPDSFRLGGLMEVAENVAALIVGGLVMCCGLLLSRRADELSVAIAAVVFASAGIAADLALLAIETYPLGRHDIAVVVSLPIWFALSAGILSAAVGIAFGNMKLIPLLEERRGELRALLEQSEEREGAIKAQVSQLLHGPILGRLSACIMALNFFLAEPEHKRGLRRTATTEGVLAHLRLVSIDLEQLSDSAG